MSELNNDSFLSVSGDSEIISYVLIRLNTNENSWEDSNLKFNKGYNKYNLVNHKKKK